MSKLNAANVNRMIVKNKKRYIFNYLYFKYNLELDFHTFSLDNNTPLDIN